MYVQVAILKIKTKSFQNKFTFFFIIRSKILFEKIETRQ